MSEAIALAEKIASISPFAMLVIVLWLGATKRWVWGYQLSECEARAVVAVTAAEKREQEWKEIARSGHRLTEQSLQVAKESKS